jgi:hypothetical protein
VYNINIRRLGCMGHIIRMEDESFHKKVLNGKFCNKRPVGKLKAKWMSSGGTYHRS